MQPLSRRFDPATMRPSQNVPLGGDNLVIIGELINSSSESIRRTIEMRDETALLELARMQVDCGADYIDLNCSALGADEEASLTWMVSLIQGSLNVGISIDSPNPEILLRFLPRLRGRPLVNSVTADSPQLPEVLQTAKDLQAKVVGLCMSGRSLPQSPEESAEYAGQLISAAQALEFPVSHLYLDPLVRPMSADSCASKLFLESLHAVRSLRQDVKTICGLSNISYGMPMRRALNRAFLPLAVAYGLDAAILDPSDKLLMSALHAARALTDPVNGIAEYIAAYRAGRVVT